jgi:uncharacterized protein
LRLLPGVASGQQPGVLVERNAEVPMRDGTILRADVHRPDRGGPYPVLLLRTPYGKHQQSVDRYVKAGYIVVCQDVRGRYASDGTFESFVRPHTHDAEDGYDTVQWASHLPNATGRVGTTGASYNAFVQWRLAPLRPSALVAMSARTIPARYTDLEGPGTIRPGRRLHWWIATIGPDLLKRTGRTPAEAFRRISDPKAQPWLWFIPWRELSWEVFATETDAVHHWLKDPHIDPWKLDEGCREIVVPNLDVVGWYDHCNGNMLLYQTMAAEARTETARRGSRIVIGPWSHNGLGQHRFGDIDFGPEAAVDITALEIRWFDYWLKGRPNGLDRDPPVRIFVMGDNRWRDEPRWPLDRTGQKTLFLSGNGRANTPVGDGRLLGAAPSEEAADRYVYDPRDPVRSLFGPAAFTIPADQRPLAHRQDILVYQTDPLTERLEVTGRPVVELHAASSAPDTDWFVRLIDVAPEGLARDVAQGMVRARYREGLDKPTLPTPGEVVKYAITMGPTSNAFLPGHRIRLDVTSSDFPNYDRNHNTAADQNADAALQSANQTIHHGPTHSSRLILPWVPDK